MPVFNKCTYRFNELVLLKKIARQKNNWHAKIIVIKCKIILNFYVVKNQYSSRKYVRVIFYL